MSKSIPMPKRSEPYWQEICDIIGDDGLDKALRMQKLLAHSQEESYKKGFIDGQLAHKLAVPPHYVVEGKPYDQKG